jgi:hypothetical protein
MQHVRNGMVGTEELEANYSESACSSTEEKRVTDRGEIDSVPMAHESCQENQAFVSNHIQNRGSGETI